MANQTENNQAPVAYFKSLTLENVKCFKGKQTIDLSDGKDKPAQWTVILGNNNTGKTTILRALANLEARKSYSRNESEYHPLFFLDDQFLIYYLGQFQISSNLYLINIEDFKNTQSLNNKINFMILKDWSFGGSINSLSFGTKYSNSKKSLNNLIIYGYGVTRKSSKDSSFINQDNYNTAGLFSNDIDLLNVEEWLLQTYLASKEVKAAEIQLEKIKKVLISGVLPDVKDFEFVTETPPLSDLCFIQNRLWRFKIK
ncbi:MAG: ATP-binding protein [Microscillaceae bacterium]|jgi:hypothetical protein|nr:ATP-binding protein [Microscillaceae bacterium]